MMSLSVDKEADIIDAFKSLCRYLDDLLNIFNINYLVGMVIKFIIHPNIS